MSRHLGSRCFYLIEFSSNKILPRGSQLFLKGNFWGLWKGSLYQCLSEPHFLSQKKFSITPIHTQEPSLFHRMSTLRYRIIKWIDQHFSPYNSKYVKVLFLGDKSNFPKKDKELYSSFGILYLLAISGFHIQFIFGGLKGLLYLVPGNPKIKNITLWVMLTPIIPLTGYGPAVFRAVLAQGIKEFNMASESHWTQGFQFTNTFIICFFIEPSWLLNLGFQLSFAATFAIHQFKWINLRPQALSISLRALLGTIGLLIIHFGEISLLGIIAQLVSQAYIALIMSAHLLQCLLELVGVVHGLDQVSHQIHVFHINYLELVAPLNEYFILSSTDQTWLYLYGFWVIYSLWLTNKKSRFKHTEH